MAEIIWTEPAVSDLDEIAGYVALDNPDAASMLVKNTFSKVDRLADFPLSGRNPPELPHSLYREVVVPPCRVFYRVDGEQVLILSVIREERKLREYMLKFD